VGLRQGICELARDESKGALREKERLLRDAEDALSRVRLIGDVLVGAFFGEEKDKAREKERVRRMGVVSEWLRSGLPPTEDLLRMQAEVLEKTPVFHWMVEFPEVFYGERADPLEGGKVNRAAFMDAFVGNPPFFGGSMSGTFGDPYFDWLKNAYPPGSGKTDLCAFFLRLADSLLGSHGTYSFVTTNTISQGDTRQAGLQPIVQMGTKIYDALPSLPWPGDAAVVVSVIHAAKGAAALEARPTLSGVPVQVINSRLRPAPERADPSKLAANRGLSFIGSKIYGQGFLLAPDEAASLVAINPRNAERLFAYIGGEDVNTSPSLTSERSVINFGTMDLAAARQWPELLELVEARVRPERMRTRDTADGKRLKELWWQFFRTAPELYDSIRPLKRCLVNSQVSKHLIFAFQPSDRIFAHTLYAFPLDKFSQFALLQSRVHEPWARLLSSSLEDRLRYTPTDCFETFPFPRDLTSLEPIGERLYTVRDEHMVATNQGLTKTYNALKDPANTDPAILALRELHLELDRAVLAAYGWSDIEVPPFTEPVSAAEQAARQAFEDEVIDRLFVLNAERAKEEERAGLTGGKKGKKTGKKKAAKKDDGGQQSLV
jgi:hypothetical protein